VYLSLDRRIFHAVLWASLHRWNLVLETNWMGYLGLAGLAGSAFLLVSLVGFELVGRIGHVLVLSKWTNK